MTWEFAPVFDAGHRAALSGGKPLIYVCPPAGWAARPLFVALPPAAGPGLTVVVVPEATIAWDVATALGSLTDLGYVHPASGLARTERLVRGAAVRTLVATVPDTLALVRRSALKLETVHRLVIGWPEELLAAGLDDALDTLLSEAQGAQHLVLTADETRAPDFLERHARRAGVVWAARLPPGPTGRARYAIVDRARRPWAVRAALDVLAPARAVLWDPMPGAVERWADITAAPDVSLYGAGQPRGDVAVAVDLPSADALMALRAAAGETVVLLEASQLDYLARIAAPLDALRLHGAADRARDGLFALRHGVRQRIEGGIPLAELLALEPLFDEHDPALIAAALLAGQAHSAPLPARAEDLPTWARVHIDAGRRDRVRAGDLVGALLNAVGLAKTDVGRIEIREGFTLVDVRAEEAERAARGLNGATIRGKRITARLDRR